MLDNRRLGNKDSAFYVVQGVGKYSVQHKNWAGEAALVQGEREFGRALRFCNRYLDRMGDKQNLNFPKEFSVKERLEENIMKGMDQVRMPQTQTPQSISQSLQSRLDQFSYPHQSMQGRDTFGNTLGNEESAGKNDYIQNIQAYLDENQNKAKKAEGSRISLGQSSLEEQKEVEESMTKNKSKGGRRAIFEKGHIPLSAMQSNHNVNHIQGRFGDKSKFSFEGNVFDNVKGSGNIEASSPRFNRGKEQQPVRVLDNRGRVGQRGGEEQISSNERDGDTYDCNSYFKNLIRSKFQQKKRPANKVETRSKIKRRFNLDGIDEPLDIAEFNTGRNTNSYVSLIKKHQDEKRRREERVKYQNEYSNQTARGKKKRVKSRGFKPFKSSKSKRKSPKPKPKVISIALDELSMVSQNRKKPSTSRRRSKMKKQKSSKLPYARDFMRFNTHRPSSNRRAKKRQPYTDNHVAAFETPISKRRDAQGKKNRKSPLKVIHQDGSFLNQFIRPGFPDSSSKRQGFISTNREFSPLSSPVSSPHRKRPKKRVVSRGYKMQKKQSKKVLIDVDMLSKRTMAKMKRSLI